MSALSSTHSESKSVGRIAGDSPTSRVLLTDAETAAVLGIGVRTFNELRDEPWMPKPVMLGPRLLRWSRAEIEQAVASMPRKTERSEPAELRRARIDRMKSAERA